MAHEERSLPRDLLKLCVAIAGRPRVFRERAPEKKRLLNRFLGSMAKKDPVVLVREMEKFEAFLKRDDRRKYFTEVAAFLDPYYAQARGNLGRDADDIHRLFALTDNP